MSVSLRSAIAVVFLGTACAASPSTSTAPAGSDAPRPPAPSGSSFVAPEPTSSPARGMSAADVFAKLRPDLVACYEQGRKSVPEMTSGRMTLRASIDRDGRAACVVPSDDTGLTQEVEDCMRERLEREPFPKSAASWTVALPMVLRDAALSMSTGPHAPLLDTIESHGLTEEVYDIIKTSMPELRNCVQGAGGDERRVIYVGARVGRDGHVDCALASSEQAVPVEVRDCAARVLARLQFKPPQRGYGLLSVPIAISRGLP